MSTMTIDFGATDIAAKLKLQSEPFNEPKEFRWTREAYYQLESLGFFTDKKVELLNGEIINRNDADNYRWTRSECYKLEDSGFFRNTKIELIDGRIIEMSPIYSPHATTVTLVGEALRAAFGNEYHVREQGPLDVDESNDPLPDIAVIKGKIRDFKDHHPSDAALIVEVSDSTLRYDQRKKASLYARQGIQDYWIVNLKNRQVEVYRVPVEDSSAAFWHSYADVQIFTEENSLSPLAQPTAVVAVADLLP